MFIHPSRMFALLAMSCGFANIASTARGEDEIKLPDNPAAWINSPPLTKEMLAGKAVYLYYFEEGCPSCREKWPSLLEETKKFNGKPVVFIGVNSGTPRQEVQEYVSDVGVPWPVIVDTDRTLEKQSKVGTISLNNIYQAKMLMPDGRLNDADSDEMDSSVERGLKTAKWRVDPAEIPDALKPIWLQVELGNFAAASAGIKGASNSPKPDVKAAGGKLLAAVTDELKKEIDTAKQDEASGKKWNAYRSFSALTTRFRGYELPSEVAASIKTLAADTAVKNEMAAAKQWEGLQRAANSPNPPSLKVLSGQVARLVQQYPDTEAAKSAQTALDQLNAKP